jgi:hypothetical protein
VACAIFGWCEKLGSDPVVLDDWWGIDACVRHCLCEACLCECDEMRTRSLGCVQRFSHFRFGLSGARYWRAASPTQSKYRGTTRAGRAQRSWVRVKGGLRAELREDVLRERV